MNISKQEVSTTGNRNQCDGEHHYFLADVVVNTTEGVAFVLAICTSCGNVKAQNVQVGHSGDQFRLLLEEKRKE